MSGKTTNLEIIHKKAPKDAVGEMVSIATETDRTLYFDFLPLDLGQVAGMRTKFQLYTVPGQIYYNATRKLVLQGVDGVIFVADSTPDKMPENLESLQNLRDNLAEMNLTIDDVPLVLQYNKRDLPNALSIAAMNAEMNPMNAPVFEGVAREGKGVFATLKEISRLVIEKLNKEHAPAANRRRTNSSLTPTQSPTPTRPAGANTPAQVQALPPQTMAPAHSNTPLSQPRLPPRPPPPASQPAPRPQPAAQAAPPSPPPAPAPAPPAAAAPADNLRDKHLAKAKPPALERAQPQKINLGATDPSLKRYQETQKPGTAGIKTLLMVLIALIVAMILIVILVVFVPPVRALLPIEIQQKLLGPGSAPPSAPAPAAPAITPAAPAPAPATPAAAPTAVTPAPAVVPAAAAATTVAKPAAAAPVAAPAVAPVASPVAPPAALPAAPAAPAAVPAQPAAAVPAATVPAAKPPPSPTTPAAAAAPAAAPAEGANGK
jgi:hypothetical protein